VKKDISKNIQNKITNKKEENPQIMALAFQTLVYSNSSKKQVESYLIQKLIEVKTKCNVYTLTEKPAGHAPK
jgi:hypothetical protein